MFGTWPPLWESPFERGPTGLREFGGMRKAMLVVVGLLALAAAVAWFLLKRSHAVLDPAEVERIAARLLPGARPPAGLKGVLALEPEDLEVAIFAPSLAQARTEAIEPGGLRILIARPNKPEPPDPTEVMEKVGRLRKEQSEVLEVLAKHPVLLSLGGRKYPAEESELKIKSNGRPLRQNFTVVMVEKHPVLLIITGGEPPFNEAARDEFLANLSAPAGPSLPAAQPPRPRFPGPPRRP